MNDKQRLIELLSQPMRLPDRTPANSIYIIAEAYANRLIENGVIVPPCRVGDTVYQRDNAGNVYESRISKIIYDTANGIAFNESAIGKSIFLTREEAEETFIRSDNNCDSM